MEHIAILGAGQAGVSAAAKLRGLGFDGRLTLIGDEDVLPYQRPPLSKKYLLNEISQEQLFLRSEKFYRDNDISLMTGRRVTGLDPDRQRLILGPETLGYDQLILTTGARPRHLPASLGGKMPGFHVIRNLADVDRVAPEFCAGRRVLIVGGGYIGLEAAAVAARLGLEVTLVEMAPRILQRVAASETSDYFRDLHHAHGVTIREGMAVQSLDRGKGIIATLSDNTRIEADFVIVGIGVDANDELAAGAGLTCNNGILVDARGRSSNPAIWAAGDCARFPHRNEMIRLESVQNAIDQAEAVASNVLGATQDYVPYPWFWSDQYDVKLQIAGLNTGFDNIATRQSDDGKSRSHWYFRKDQLLSVDAMNDPRSYMIGKRLIEKGHSPSLDQVADTDFNLKSLL